jgi:methionine sulfoxide reductase heme-binding subunit
MSTSNIFDTLSSRPSGKWARVLAVAAPAGLAVALLAGGSANGFIADLLNKWFATSSVQAMWYVTRAAGLISYLLVWLSTVWGLAVSNKILDPVLHRSFTYDFHEYLSLLAIGFMFLHVGVLLADKYLPFSVAQILVPFAAPYRPVWVGIGTIGLYLTLLVSITFYIRRWIGQKTFRLIHLASYLAFVAAALHGLFAGTDSPLPTVQVMYVVTTLSVVFLTVYRIVTSKRLDRRSLAA